ALYQARPEDIFFFQAEDGIRDKLVTGVQTCALPILQARQPGPTQSDAHQDERRYAARSGQQRRDAAGCQRARCASLIYFTITHRSEERRVGKECRSERAADDVIEKSRVVSDDVDVWG